MIFIDNIKELEYYNQSSIEDCYYDYIDTPHDLTLQVTNLPATPIYELFIWAHYADGTGPIGGSGNEISRYFDWYFAKAPNGSFYLNIRLNSNLDIFCSVSCFILRVQIRDGNSGINQILFDKYTQRYKMPGCCSGVSGVIATVNGSTQNLAYSCGSVVNATNNCGETYVKFTTQFDCFDEFTGEYYGDPSVIISYNNQFPIPSFNYIKIANINAIFRDLPATIKRTISFNCTTQKTEITRAFQLQCQKGVPIWKKQEIENMLLATYLFIDGFQYQYDGSSPFTALHKCDNDFKLVMNFQECLEYQTHGCPVDCSEVSTYFLFQTAPNNGNYYDDAGLLIARNEDELLTYFRTYNMVTGVEEFDTVGLDVPMNIVLQVKSYANLPAYIYAGAPTPVNKVFGVKLDANSPLLNSLVKPAQNTVECSDPVIGAIVATSITCADPVIGTITKTSIGLVTQTISNGTNWTKNASLTDGQVNLTNAVGTLNISTVSTAHSLTGSPASVPYLSSEWIMTLSAAPLTAQTLDYTNNPQLPNGTSFYIDTAGKVYFTGFVNEATNTNATIEAFNLTYPSILP
jgi:hypothetical protein